MNAIAAPSRAAGLARGDAFAPAMGRHYASARNYDYGPERRGNVSALSPHIRHRLVTEDELAAKALAHHSYAAAEKFLQEVFWRTYWKGWLELRPSVWDDYKASRDDWLDVLSKDGGLRAAYDAAVAGNTGIECFDAWAAELEDIGYLHNHTRMWFASIWIFTLGLPWELGADTFLTRLLDGDAASNTLSWRWVAGLQTQGKTYLARADNIETYTDGRFSPERSALAPEAPAVAGLPNPAAGEMPMGAPMPTGPYALLIHEDDCAFETLGLPHAPSKIYVQASPAPRGSSAVSAPAEAFTVGALEDTADRARSIYGDCVEAVALSDLPSDLPLYAAYAPVGPLRDSLPAEHSIHWILREMDKTLWPHATKGFFKFKKAIPEMAERLA
ncbi:MAG: FAD-binding domain-containing protein [Pseudomonadota bacterium]